jgi:hypothetical protein
MDFKDYDQWLKFKCLEFAMQTPKSISGGNVDKMGNKEKQEALVDETLSLADIYYKRVSKWLSY